MAVTLLLHMGLTLLALTAAAPMPLTLGGEAALGQAAPYAGDVSAAMQAMRESEDAEFDLADFQFGSGEGFEPFEGSVANFSTNAYLGRWYQTYASANVKYSFQLGGNCVTADYVTTDTPGVISVLNTVRLSSWFPDITIRGFAVQSSEAPDRLQVSLGHKASKDTPFSPPGNYWVIGAGPFNNDGLYDWAVVSDERRSQLYVLCRDVNTFRDLYEDEVLARVIASGFTNVLNRPRPTGQTGCNY